jgi:hypothetical protein
MEFIKIFIFSYLTCYTYFFYGYLFSYKNKNFNKQLQTDDIGKISLLGIIFLSFIGLFINFLFPLNIYLNTIILCLVLFLYLIDRKNFFNKKLIKYNFVIAILSSLLLIYANINRPDAALYHLPYISFLNEHKIIMGLGNIHSRFGHISIIQYLAAINYNFLYGINGISIPLAVIVSVFIVFFYRQVLIFYKSKLLNLDFYFCLFVSIYILYKINRYSGFANDAVTHLCFFYLIRLILIDRKFKELSLIILLCVFIFLNKNTYLFIFLFPIIIYFNNKIYLNYKKTLRLFFSFSTFFLLLWCLKNIFISGCLIYPIHQTCIQELKWTDKIGNIKSAAQNGEAWSKGWPQNKNKTLKVEEFNDNLNWFKAWSSVHGKYVGKTLFPYLFFLIILNIYFQDKIKKKKVKNRNYNLCLTLTIILTFIFFIKFPLYRYGYSYLISAIILLNLNNFKQFNFIKVINFTKIILIIFPFIFVGKQLQRYYEKSQLNYINKPWPNIYSLNNNKISKKNLVIRFENLDIFNSNGECGYSNAVCTNYEIKKNINVYKKFTYYIIFNVNKKKQSPL